MKRAAVAVLSAGLILAAWYWVRGGSAATEPGMDAIQTARESTAPASRDDERPRTSAGESKGTAAPSVPEPNTAPSQAISGQEWTPEAFMLLPEDQRRYTPTSRARAKWMSLHAFPTPESLARTDEDRLRDEAEHCNRRSANTLIEKLAQRKDEEWRPLAEFEASRGSLFAARAVLRDEIAKGAGKGDPELIVRMTTIVAALGGTGLEGEISLAPGSRNLPDVDWQRAAGAMERAFRELDWWESRSRTKTPEQNARNPCTVVRAIEPPHPWTAGMSDFYKRHPEYN